VAPISYLSLSPKTWLSREVRRLPSPTPTRQLLALYLEPSHLAQLKTPIRTMITSPTARSLNLYPQLYCVLIALTNQSAVKVNPPATKWHCHNSQKVNDAIEKVKDTSWTNLVV
jgi:hypothetical protein